MRKSLSPTLAPSAGVKSSCLESHLSRLKGLVLSILLTATALLSLPAFAGQSDTCAQAFPSRDYSPVTAKTFVHSTDKGFRFDPNSFGESWALLLKSLPTDVEANVVDGPVLKLQISPKKSAQKTRQTSNQTHSKSLNQTSTRQPLRLLMTAGIHGNEPLGVQTALDVVATLMADKEARANIEITLLPTLNEYGLLEGTRADEQGQNRNREIYRDSSDVRIQQIQAAIGDTPYDIALDLHGGIRRKDFFVIKSGDDQHLATRALGGFSSDLLLRADSGARSGHAGVWQRDGTYDATRYFLLAPGLSVSTNAGTLKSYVYELGTPRSYTLEYPGALPLKEARAKYLELVMNFIFSHESLLAERK